MFISNHTWWHSCGCHGHCHCARYWCATCCRYTHTLHYHPPVIYTYPHQCEPLPRPKKKHRPYVDITPALPYRGCL